MERSAGLRDALLLLPWCPRLGHVVDFYADVVQQVLHLTSPLVELQRTPFEAAVQSPTVGGSTGGEWSGWGHNLRALTLRRLATTALDIALLHALLQGFRVEIFTPIAQEQCT